MKLKLEYLAGCGAFTACCFRTPFYGKEVSSLELICGNPGRLCGSRRVCFWYAGGMIPG